MPITKLGKLVKLSIDNCHPYLFGLLYDVIQLSSFSLTSNSAKLPTVILQTHRYNGTIQYKKRYCQKASWSEIAPSKQPLWKDFMLSTGTYFQVKMLFNKMNHLLKPLIYNT